MSSIRAVRASVVIAVGVAAAVTAGSAGAASQFDPAVVHALCDRATDLGRFAAPPPRVTFVKANGTYASGGPSLIDAYPGWAPAEPGPEFVSRAKLRQPGWTILASDTTPTAQADVFLLRGSCKRGTMKVVAAGADLVRIDDAPAGEYLMITDLNGPLGGTGHFTHEVGIGI
jgi:hypothetical protein